MFNMCCDEQGASMYIHVHRHKLAMDGGGGLRCENKEAEGQSGVWETESQLTLLCSFYWYFVI